MSYLLVLAILLLTKTLCVEAFNCFVSVSCLRLLNMSSFVSFRLNFSLAVIRSPAPPPRLHPPPPHLTTGRYITAVYRMLLVKNNNNRTLTHGVPLRGTLLPITVSRLTTRACSHVHSRTFSIPFVIEAENYSSYHSYNQIQRVTYNHPNS